MVDEMVVVGASLAGLRAVEGARRAGFAGHLVLLGAEDHLPYDRPPLSKAFLDPVGREAAAVNLRTLEVLTNELDVDLRLGTPARGLDTGARMVLTDGDPVPYQAAVLATGSAPRRLPGTDGLAGVHTLRTVDDALAIRRALDGGARTVVIGAGFIGSEIASSVRKRDLPVTVIEALASPLAGPIGEEMGRVVAGLHPRNGTDLRCGVSVVAVEGDGRVQRVVLSDGTVLDADLVVVGVGARPATDWLDGSGIVCDDGVVCDATLASSAPGVYAAGDVARWPNPVYDGLVMRLEHWTAASEQGQRAAVNALDPDRAEPYGTVPYFWSDWYGSRIQFVGLPGTDEIVVVDGDVDEHRFVTLYRSGDRLVGALAVNRRADTMRYSQLIADRAGWDEARNFAEERRRAAAAKAAGPAPAAT